MKIYLTFDRKELLKFGVRVGAPKIMATNGYPIPIPKYFRSIVTCQSD